MKWLILALLITSSFEGCAAVQHEILISICPQSNGESFVALRKSFGNNIDTLEIVRIDSNGNTQLIQKLDSPLYRTPLEIINDSIVLIKPPASQAIQNKFIRLYNINLRRFIDSVQGTYVRCISEDRKFIAVKDTFDHMSKTGFHLYYLDGNSINAIGYFPYPNDPRFSIGKNNFVVSTRALTTLGAIIIDSSMNYLDSIPQRLGEPYSIASGLSKNEMVFIPYTYNHTKSIVCYNIQSKLADTLFTGYYFERALVIPNSNYYLLSGLSKEEYDIQYRELLKNTVGDQVFLNFTTYFFIGSRKTKKVKKIGYEGLSPVINSSGRHILFYKQDADGYQMKVVSVKELVDGM